MEIKIEESDGIVVASIKGKLDSNTAPQAQEKIAGQIKPALKMVLDMSACEYISSAGLRLILMVAKLLARQNGNGAIAGLSPEMRDIMDMTGFGNVLPGFKTVSEAMASL
jgi:anti-anti-sigma factor